VSNVRNVLKVGSRALLLVTVVRQVRQAREDGDNLAVLDAIVNGLAVLTALAIIVREIRQRSEGAGEAVEDAPL
jgi:hypothetical protein